MEDPRSIVSQAFEAFNQRRLDLHLDIYDEELECHDLAHAPGWGRLAAAEDLKSLLTAFPDAHLGVELALSAPDQVTVRYTFSGTNKGELGKLPASGLALRFRGRMSLRLQGGQVVERWSNLGLELKLQLALATLSQTGPSERVALHA